MANLTTPSLPQGLVEFPGIDNILTCDYALIDGISPSAFLCTISPQKKLPEKQGVLRWTYGNVRMEFFGVVIDTHKNQYNQSGDVTQITLLDERWAWKFGNNLSGRYNLPMANGKPDPDTEKTVEQLMRLCMAGIPGQWDFGPGGKPDAKPRPFVDWDYANPARELANLCDQFGKVVIYDPIQRRNWVCGVGKGKALPDGPWYAKSEGFNPPEKPYAITLVGAPTEYQIDVLLEAVGMDVDGKIKPLDALTYKPDAGWEKENFVPTAFFSGVKAKYRDEQSGLRAQGLAKQSCFRWFQIPERPKGLQDIPLIPYGAKGPSGEVRKIMSRKELVLLDRQVLTRTNHTTNKTEPLAPVVWGVWARGTSEWKNCVEWRGERRDVGQDGQQHFIIFGDPFPMATFRGEPTPAVLLDWELDAENYLVKLDRALVRMESTNQQANPQGGAGEKRAPLLALRIACHLRDPKTHALERPEWTFYTGARETTSHLYIRDEDLQVIVKPEYSPANDWRGAKQAGHDNKKDLKPIVDAMLKDEAAKFQDLDSGQASYAGILPVSPDGALRQIVWTLTGGPDGCCATIVYRNQEDFIYAPGFKERRFFEKVKAEEVVAIQKKVVEVSLQSGGAIR